MGLRMELLRAIMIFERFSFLGMLVPDESVIFAVDCGKKETGGHTS